MKAPFPAYTGDDSFIFVSYAHASSNLVFEELLWLNESGINIWYDEGIAPGSRWPDALASAIERCDLFVVLLTAEAASSEHCLNEIDFALKRNRPFLAVELEPVELPAGIELNIGSRQSILKYQFEPDEYRSRLLTAISRNRNDSAVRTRGAGTTNARTPLGGRRRQRFALLSAIVAITAVIVIAVVAWQAGEPDYETVAVLPFKNLSADPEYEYLADGLADELITILGGVNDLGVSSRTSSFYYKDQTPLMPDIRKRLGVEHAVEGSIRRNDDELIVNVNLFETFEGRQVWTQHFKTPHDAFGGITTDIARAIAAKLVPDATLTGEHWSTGSDTVSTTAYDYFLKGLEFLNQPPSPEVLTAARVHFEQALLEAPEFVRAEAALCETHLAFHRMARTEDIGQHYEEATRHCQQALALDSTLWSGRQSLAVLYRREGRYDDALREIRLADTLQPRTASIHHEYGKILAARGQSDQAEAKFLTAIELDPGFWGGYADLGDFYYDLGRYALALQQFQQVQKLTPDSGLALVSLGAAHYMLDDPESARTAWQRSIDENPDSASRAYWQAATWLGITALNQGCMEEAAYWQQRALSVSPNDHRLWGRLAEACHAQQDDYLDRVAPHNRSIYQHAIDLALRELEHNPNDWETNGALAVYRARIGEAEGTDKLITKMLTLQPDNVDAMEIALAHAHQSGNRTAQAELEKRLVSSNYPPGLLQRNPFLSPKLTCSNKRTQSQRLICAEETVIPDSAN